MSQRCLVPRVRFRWLQAQPVRPLQHVAHFAAGLPQLTFQPTECEADDGFARWRNRESKGQPAMRRTAGPARLCSATVVADLPISEAAVGR